MDEQTKVTSAAGEDWDIDLSDIDMTDDDSDLDGVEETNPSSGETDRLNRTEGGAGAELREKGDGGESDKFSLKYLGETKTVSRDEAVILAQKGMDYDRIRQKFDELTTAHGELNADRSKQEKRMSELDKQAQANGYRNIDEFLDNMQATKISKEQGVDRELALEKIKLERERRELETRGENYESPEELAKKDEEKRENDFLEFIGEYRELDPAEVSKEVWDIYRKGGCTLVQAYMKHENAVLRARLASDQKTAENRDRSTGSRASAGKTASKDKEDELWYRN